VFSLNGQPAKYDQAKTILETTKENDYCNSIARSKEEQNLHQQ
jgi:hypothetical protein